MASDNFSVCHFVLKNKVCKMEIHKLAKFETRNKRTSLYKCTAFSKLLFSGEKPDKDMISVILWYEAMYCTYKQFYWINNSGGTIDVHNTCTCSQPFSQFAKTEWYSSFSESIKYSVYLDMRHIWLCKPFQWSHEIILKVL